MSSQPASSRSSSLPQGSWVERDFTYIPNPVWERACSRRRLHSQHHRHRPTAIASRLAPTGLLGGQGFRVYPESSVGASLLAKAAAQPTSPAQTHRYREQAPTAILGRNGFRVYPESSVGASLLAKAAAQPTSPAQTHRYREQARSHRALWWTGISRISRIQCGSELARDSGLSGDQSHPGKHLSPQNVCPRFR